MPVQSKEKLDTKLNNDLKTAVLTYGSVRPMGASGPGVDPLQGSRDPWGTWTTREPWFEFCTCFFCNSFSWRFRWKWIIICDLADKAVCHTEHSCKHSDLWSATCVFGCKWTDCQWGSCATCSIQHGPRTMRMRFGTLDSSGTAHSI